MVKHLEKNSNKQYDKISRKRKLTDTQGRQLSYLTG